MWGPFYLTHAFSKILIENKPAALVNIISIGALMPLRAASTYAASKAALHSLTHTTRIEMAEHDIPVFGVYPGPIDTDMTNNLAVKKESAKNLAIRVFDNMEKGEMNITTDSLSDLFINTLKLDAQLLQAVSKEFGKGASSETQKKGFKQLQ